MIRYVDNDNILLCGSVENGTTGVIDVRGDVCKKWQRSISVYIFLSLIYNNDSRLGCLV